MTAEPQRTPLARDAENRVLGGVCSGIARSLGIDPLIVRVAMVAAVFAGGLGLALYAAGMIALPVSGRRRGRRTLRRRRRTGGGLALGVAWRVRLAALLVARELGLWWTDAIVWPLVIAMAGAAVIWWQASGSEATEDRHAASRPPRVLANCKRCANRASGSDARPAAGRLRRGAGRRCRAACSSSATAR